MSKPMRAKLSVQSVTPHGEPVSQESLHFAAVCGTDPFGPNGESEDNTYARYTPMADLRMTVTNPALLGEYKPGQKFYVDFTPAD